MTDLTRMRLIAERYADVGGLAFSAAEVLALFDRLAEAEDAESRLNLLLDEQTGGRLSYTTYPVSVMNQEIDAYHDRLTEEDRAEYRAIADEALKRAECAEKAIADALAVADNVNLRSHHWMLRDTRRILASYETTKTENGSENDA